MVLFQHQRVANIASGGAVRQRCRLLPDHRCLPSGRHLAISRGEDVLMGFYSDLMGYYSIL